MKQPGRPDTVRAIFDSIGTQSCYKAAISGGYHVPHALALTFGMLGSRNRASRAWLVRGLARRRYCCAA